jgi:glutaminyl-tRNA synthetase
MPATALKGIKFGTLGTNAVTAEIRLYDRLFDTAHPDASGKNLPCGLNRKSLQTITAYVEAASAKSDNKLHLERHGYFVADLMDQKEGTSVFSRDAGLKDSWSK